MDVLPATPTTIARDALTPQPQANTGHGGPPPQAMPLETVAAVLSPAQATLLKVLSEAIQNATAMQGGLAALLPDLVQAQASSALPPSVRTAISDVLTTTAELQSLPSDVEITATFLRPSATTAQVYSSPLPAAPPVTATQVRATLQTLQQALQQWEPAATAAPAASPTNPQAAPNPAAQAQLLQPTATDVVARAPAQANVATTPAATAIPGTPQSLAPGTVTATLPPSAPLAQAPLPGVPPTTSASPVMTPLPGILTQAMPAAEFGDAVASLLVLQQSARTVTQAAMKPRIGSARTGEAAPGGHDPMAADKAGFPPARSQAPGLTPISAITRWPTNPDAAFVARTLATRTENALTQFKLLEAASQMQRADERPVTPNTNEPRWAFDIPFQTPQGQSSARFEIDRDTYKARNGQLSRVWRVRFSVDVEPLGPVHAQIALMGKNAWVSIMAEREATMRTLEAQQQALLQGLGAEDMSAEVICGLGKAPHHEEQDKAGKLLDSAI